MRFIESLCPPALLYLIYIVVQVGLDISLGIYITAAVKALVGIAGVMILDSFCTVNLGVVSWVIIATPFVITALATSISLGLNLDRYIYQRTVETFTPLTGDNLKNRDKIVTPLKNQDALPVSTNSLF
jgi:hypothetical protein